MKTIDYYSDKIMADFISLRMDKRNGHLQP